MGLSGPAPSEAQSTASPDVHGSDSSEQEIYNQLRPRGPDPSLPAGLTFRGAHRAGQAEAAQPPHLALSINFSFASKEILPESQALLLKLASVMMRDDLKMCHFQIVGHTDSVGTPASNMQLSIVRADAVREFLVRQAGIASERLSVEGRGELDPINLSDGTAPENRRVDIVNLGP